MNSSTASRTTFWPRWAFLILVALVAVLAVTLSSASASAATNAGSETRVRASNLTITEVVEPPQHISAGQRLENDVADRQIVVATGVAAKTRKPPINGETSATKYGRDMHATWDYGPGFSKEFTLKAGGRVDGINFGARQVVELKPNNPRAIRLGNRQLEGYIAKLNEQFPGEPWTGRVVTYER